VAIPLNRTISPQGAEPALLALIAVAPWHLRRKTDSICESSLPEEMLVRDATVWYKSTGNLGLPIAIMGRKG
jgi:hypothetical protein